MQRIIEPSKIHHKNTIMQAACTQSGLFAQKHSKLIDKLTASLQFQGKQIVELENRTQEKPTLKQIQLINKIKACESQENLLKRQMVRIVDMARTYKQQRIETESKNALLSEQLTKLKRQDQQMNAKMAQLTQLNDILTKLAQDSLQVLHQFGRNYKEVFKFIEELRSNNPSILQLKKKLIHLKAQTDSIQNISQQLINRLNHSQMEPVSIRISQLSSINLGNLLISNNEIIQNKTEGRRSQVSMGVFNHAKLSICSHVSESLVVGGASRVQQVVQQICVLFEEQIHLLEKQKMEYQFTKNKKLVTSQKEDCQICDSYEKIVGQIFSIVREGFKQIKLHFLREVKQAPHISDIPFLI